MRKRNYAFYHARGIFKPRPQACRTRSVLSTPQVNLQMATERDGIHISRKSELRPLVLKGENPSPICVFPPVSPGRHNVFPVCENFERLRIPSVMPSVVPGIVFFSFSDRYIPMRWIEAETDRVSEEGEGGSPREKQQQRQTGVLVQTSDWGHHTLFLTTVDGSVISAPRKKLHVTPEDTLVRYSMNYTHQRVLHS